MNYPKWNIVLVLLAIVVGGCSRGPKLYPVKGEVTLNGKPVADAAVLFYREKGGRPPEAKTDAAGTFSLLSPEGTFTVIVTACEYLTPPSGTDPSAERPVRWIIPEKYSRPDSDVKVTVKPGGDNHFKLEFPQK